MRHGNGVHVHDAKKVFRLYNIALFIRLLLLLLLLLLIIIVAVMFGRRVGVMILKVDPLSNRAKIVSQMQCARWLNTRQDSSRQDLLFRGNICRFVAAGFDRGRHESMMLCWS